MKNLFVITSSINTSDVPFKYINGEVVKRSAFTEDERFRQTVYTISYVRTLDPNCDIILLDSSENYQNYKIFEHIKNLRYYPLGEFAPEVRNIVSTTSQKAYAECLMLKTFIDYARDEILKYDNFIKLSGRYTIEDVSLNDFIPGKFSIKNPIGWNIGVDDERFSLIDNRKETGESTINSYVTMFYGFDTKLLNYFYEINDKIIDVVLNPQYNHFSIEYLIYFFTRERKEIINECNWTVNGFDGVNGLWLRF